jgi:hypothetical protein
MSTQPIDFSDLGGVVEDAQPTPTAAVGQSAPQSAKPSIDFSDLGGVVESAQQSQPAQQPSEDKGFLHGIFTNTIGPMWEAAKKEHEEAKTMTLTQRFKKGVEKGVTGNPAAQAYQVIAGMLSDAYEEGAKSVKHAKNATVDYGEAAKRLVHGDFKGAEQAGNAASEEMLSAQGHGLAAAVPYFGPAAAKAGEKIGSGKPREGAGEAVALLAQAAGPSLISGASKATAATKGAVKNAVRSGVKAVDGSAIQSELQSSLRNSINAAAREAEVAEAVNTPIRDAARTVAENVERKAKAQFKIIDDATDGKLTNVQNKIKNVQQELRLKAGTDDALEQRLLEKQAALSSEIEDLYALAEREGVPVEVADAARSSWKQAQALHDLDVQIKSSTFGNAVEAAENVDPSKLVLRLQKLQDARRLAEAVGDEGAHGLLGAGHRAIKATAKHGDRVATAKAVGKNAAKGLGIGVTGALGYAGMKAALGGE